MSKTNFPLLAIVFILLKLICCARANFNYSSSYSFNDNVKDANHTRDGKFLFDTLFGLELEEELINAAAQNTLKSCDCGKHVVVAK